MVTAMPTKTGFKHDDVQIYYLDLKGKDSTQERWRIEGYYHPNYAKLFLFFSEREYKDFIHDHNEECYIGGYQEYMMFYCMYSVLKTL